MKTTSTFVMLAATLALVGCDEPKSTASRKGDEAPAPPEVTRESRSSLNTPKPFATENKDTVNVPPSEVKKEIPPGQDIPQPRVADGRDQPPALPPELKKDIRDIVDNTKTRIVESRDQFVAAMEKKLDDYDAGFQALGEKMETLKTDSYAKDTLNTLREKRGDFGQKFADLKAASRDAWKEFKTGVENAYDDMSRAYDDARAKYDK